MTAILASILLLLEPNSPFDGAIRISSAPMDCWPAMRAPAMRTPPLTPGGACAPSTQLRLLQLIGP